MWASSCYIRARSRKTTLPHSSQRDSMPRRTVCLLILLCCGCVTSTLDRRLPPGQAFDFDLDGQEVSKEIADLDRPLLQQMARETKPGSHVRVIDESGVAYMGTLLQSNAHTIRLMNCICREVVAAPNGEQQCKTSHLPYLDFSPTTINGFTVLAPPTADFRPHDAEQDHSQVTVAEFIFRNGDRLPLGSSAQQR